MIHIQYYLALVAVYLYRLHSPAIIIHKVKVLETKLDPHGLAKNDIATIEKGAVQMHWKKGDTIEDIAYRQGQQDLVKFIKIKLLGRR